MAFLRYFDEQHVLQSPALSGEKFIIGRVDSCQIAIVDDLVSREHARIDADPDGRYRIRDLGSRNKMFVNGIQISETLLFDGDVIRIGDRGFEFVDDGARADLDLSFLTPDRNDPPGTQWFKIKGPVTLPLTQHGELALLGADVGHPAKPEDVAESALGRLLLLLQADRGLAALRGDSKKELRSVAQRGFSESPGVSRTPVSRTFLYSSFLQAVVGRYPGDDGRIDERTGFAATAIAAPLLYRGDVIGVLYVDRPTAGKAFSETALHAVAAAGAHIGALMADASQRLVDASRSAATGWLSTLRRTQAATTIPPRSGDSFDVAVKLLPGQARCGDFCDVLPFGEDRLFVVLGDAGGHGVFGMIQAGAIRAAVRSAVLMEGAEPELARIVSAVNRAIEPTTARQVVTCAVIELDLSSGEIRYINAGGPPPLLLLGQKRLITLDQPALVLGVDANYAYETATADLPSPFRLICHTDGVLESANAAGEGFGTDRLHELLLDPTAFTAPADIIARIQSALEKHRSAAPPADDALLAVIGHG